MRMTARLVLDTVLLGGYLVAMNTDATGVPLHEWLSVALTVAVVVHLLTEWEWTVRVVTRFFRQLLSMSRVQLLVDVALFVTLTFVLLSGLMVSQAILPLLGLSAPVGPVWKILHALSADLVLVLVGIHVGLHWRWIVRAAKHAVTVRADVPEQAA